MNDRNSDYHNSTHDNNSNSRMAKKQVKSRKMPQVRKIKGKGDYSDEIKELTNPLQRIERKIDHVNSFVDKGKTNAGGLIGRGLGSLVGNGDLGEQAGSALAKWFGYGDYELKANSLVKAAGSSSSSTIPVFTKDGRRGTRIVEREYIGDVISSASANTFNVTKYRINPADVTTFPWLSVTASQYEEYEINGLIFEYQTSSAMYNGTSQALGTVTMMTEYDPTDADPASLMVMQNADYSCSTVSCNNLQHGVECDPKERNMKTLYTSVETPSATDVRFCDLGNFYVATSGMAGTSVNIGQLWVSYDITFFKKQLVSGPASLKDVNIHWTDSTNAIPSTPFGTTFTRSAYGPLTLRFNAAGSKFQLPGISTGRFRWIYTIIQANHANNGSPTFTCTNCAETTAGALTIHSSMNPGGAATNYKIVFTQVFTVTGPDPIVQVNLAGWTSTDPTGSSMYMYVEQLNNTTTLTTAQTLVNGLVF